MVTCSKEKFVQQRAFLQQHFLYGRPIWDSFLSNRENLSDTVLQKNLPLALDLAVTKVLGGVDFKTMKECDEDQMFSCFASRTLVLVSGDRVMAEKMVASYCAYVTNISDDRSFINMGFLSDPIMMEAAARLMYSPLFSIEKCASIVNGMMKKGMVDPGPRGEFIARLISILSFDKSCMSLASNLKYPLFTRPISLKTFLLNFTIYENFLRAADNQVDEEKLNCMLDGSVFFTHAVQITYTPTVEQLRDLYERGVFVNCKRGQSGIDCLIPLKLKDGRYSFVGIQSRVYSLNDPKLKTASQDITAEKIGIELDDVPYLILYHSFGYENTEILNLKELSAETEEEKVGSMEIEKGSKGTKGERADSNISKLKKRKNETLVQAKRPKADKIAENDPNQVIVGFLGLSEFIFSALSPGICDTLEDMLISWSTHQPGKLDHYIDRQSCPGLFSTNENLGELRKRKSRKPCRCKVHTGNSECGCTKQCGCVTVDVPCQIKCGCNKKNQQ